MHPRRTALGVGCDRDVVRTDLKVIAQLLDRWVVHVWWLAEAGCRALGRFGNVPVTMNCVGNLDSTRNHLWR